MTLDLDELTEGWDCPSGELRARLAVGRDGTEVVQIRVDLGVMQMHFDGRPDGQRYHGLPSAREYVEHELRVGGQRLVAEDWRELQREMNQVNYRRLAYSALAEDALQANDSEATQRFILSALRDIETCLANLQLLDQHGPRDEFIGLRPTLVFDQARLIAQLRVVEGQFEEAIEHAEAGAEALGQLLVELGYDEDMRNEDPGVCYLRDLGRQLRMEYGVAQTLRERLEEALENEDFEAAARIRDAMQRRGAESHPDEKAAPEQP